MRCHTRPSGLRAARLCRLSRRPTAIRPPAPPGGAAGGETVPIADDPRMISTGHGHCTSSTPWVGTSNHRNHVRPITISPRGSAGTVSPSANRDPISTSLTTVKHHARTCDRTRSRRELSPRPRGRWAPGVRTGRRSELRALESGAHEDERGLAENCKSSTGVD